MPGRQVRRRWVLRWVDLAMSTLGTGPLGGVVASPAAAAATAVAAEAAFFLESKHTLKMSCTDGSTPMDGKCADGSMPTGVGGRRRTLKAKTLRRMLKGKGLKTTGKKATLMKRLKMKGGMLAYMPLAGGEDVSKVSGGRRRSRRSRRGLFGY